jgi:hypothetical protein
MNNLPNDILREVCKFLYVKECIHVEEILFGGTSETYKLYDITDYVERKKYEPYVRKVDKIEFCVKYINDCFVVDVYSNKNEMVEKYYINNVSNASVAYSKALHMFLRGPGFRYGNFFYTFVQ